MRGQKKIMRWWSCIITANTKRSKWNERPLISQHVCFLSKLSMLDIHNRNYNTLLDSVFFQYWASNSWLHICHTGTCVTDYPPTPQPPLLDSITTVYLYFKKEKNSFQAFLIHFLSIQYIYYCGQRFFFGWIYLQC